MMPPARRPGAIELRPDPALTARFAADLARLWPDGEARLGLAVSGGVDSLALLLLAAAALPGRVAVASVDHGLRPESAGEAAMVAGVCARLDVPHETLRVTLAPGNLQHRARAARYEALGEWCGRNAIAALATAHQLDDQAETLLMRLNRGSGLAGLAGVRARGTVPGTTIPLLRPLLGWRRAELATLVAGAGLEPARDPSNADPRYDRVRVRRALEQADWLDPKGLARSAALLAEAEGFVGEAVERARQQQVTRTAEGYRLIPGPSRFETIELVGRILGELGAQPSRQEIAAMVGRLERGENASLGGVLARATASEWVFAPEPPRKD